jgi:hypothetical protein
MAEEDAYEVNNRRAEWSAYILIAGLVLELASALVFQKDWIETVATVIAIVLIVGGVWGEVHFGHKAREAGDRQLAEFEARTAEANAQAAKANNETAILRLQLDQEIQKRAPRRLTDEQKAALVAELRGKMKEINLVVQKDIETKAFEIQWLDVFGQAGIEIHPYELPTGEVFSAPAGVMMYSPSGRAGTGEEPLKDDPLYIALKKANIFGGTTSRPFLTFDMRQQVESVLRQGQPLGKDILDAVPQLSADTHVLYIGQKHPF